MRQQTETFDVGLARQTGTEPNLAQISSKELELELRRRQQQTSADLLATHSSLEASEILASYTNLASAYREANNRLQNEKATLIQLISDLTHAYNFLAKRVS